MKICTRCYELKEMYHGRNCFECRKKFLKFLQKERSKKSCPVCKIEHNGNTIECSTKCKILNRYKIVNECWEWQGKINESGYGCLNVREEGEKIDVLVHRKSYEIFKGEIPRGLWVLHKCDNPACINPEHLWLGNAKDNNQDRAKKGRSFNGRARAIASGRLTEEEVIEIRKLFRDGMTRKELREKFNLSQSHCDGILSYKFWKHTE